MSAPSRVLVVEDDRAWQEILAEILGDRGLAVDLVDNVADAIERLRAEPHRLAVVDLSLDTGDSAGREGLPRKLPLVNQDLPAGRPPETSSADEDRLGGLRVLEAARRHDPGCVTVLLSGYATVELAVSALNEYGAHSCLRKETFRRSQFRELLDRVLALPPAPALAQRAPAMAGNPDARADVGPGVGGGSAGNALLVEDDAGWRRLLAELLEEAGYAVRAANSFGEALGYLRREHYALAVVDLALASSVAPAANQDGFEILARARAAAVPTIVVSGSATPAAAELAYTEYGAYAYLEKQGFERRAFLAAIAEAARAGAPGDDPLALLTPRERDVLELLVQGLTNKGIANALVISTNTVKRYLKSIFEKLDVDSRSAAVARAITAGLPAAPRRE